MKKKLGIIKSEPLLLIALPISLISLFLIVLVRPLIKIRIGFLRCDRIGHFAPHTELYLCERDINENTKKTLDLFYYPREICNRQLAKMWERKLHILPWFWLRPLCLIIRTFDLLSPHKVIEPRGHQLDVDNLLDRLPPHLSFSEEEEELGKAGLESMGIPDDAPFVCLIVRDDAYLENHYNHSDFGYHDYRNSDIKNFKMATKELADAGYYVIRMGAKVREKMEVEHSKVIDYATNGMRSDFMDIWLGANCAFCVTTGTGLDAIPEMFRRPIVYVNILPLGMLHTFRKEFISLSKKHVWIENGKELSMKEIFEAGVGYCLASEAYESKGVRLIERTPEEIRDVAMEMAKRLNGTWNPHTEDEALQKRFWDAYPTDPLNVNFPLPLHGEIRALYGADFLRNNRWWLE